MIDTLREQSAVDPQDVPDDVPRVQVGVRLVVGDGDPGLLERLERDNRERAQRHLSDQRVLDASPAVGVKAPKVTKQPPAKASLSSTCNGC